MSFRVKVVDNSKALSLAKQKAKKKKRMKKYVALLVVGLMTFAYSASEIVLYAFLKGHSVAMLTDGLHNFSDVAQLFIAFIALKKSSSGDTERYTYGWKRTEVIGALMNACFLISLCIYIFVEAIEKFISPTKLYANHLDGVMFLAVAGSGIMVNGLGTIIFAVLGGHGHSHGGHGGHGHSHGGGHGHKQSHSKKKEDKESLLGDERPSQRSEGSFIKKQNTKDLNMSAVFLHYLGDCVASGLLLATGLLAYFYEDKIWTQYLDPIASLLISVMLLWSSVPLTKECGKLLLRQVPENLEILSIRRKLSQIVYLQGFHDLHIWSLAEDITIGTVHACVFDTDVVHVETVKENIKKVFHHFHIHSTTVQIEIISAADDESPWICKHNCAVLCTEDWCCKGLNHAPEAMLKTAPQQILELTHN